ncbi:MAG TPA: hypothetical protein VFB58_00715 [Chloroflexota bacterium]|nr:hypothetical protein [Chloroflexota bacterium]
MADGTQQPPQTSNGWAQPVPKVKVSHVPEGAVNLNVDGRQLSGPLQGFGPMWQKTYSIVLPPGTATPEEAIRVWKENFTDFWLPGDHFYGPLSGLNPGDVALINSKESVPGGLLKLSTGVMVVYADDTSFTLMTTQGHPFSGWVTFSSYEAEGGTRVQAQVLMRANDPMWEFGMRFLGGHRTEDRIWQHTLSSVAAHFGVAAPISTEIVCVDKKIQWGRAGNIWQNAGIRSGMYMTVSPFLRFRSAVRGSRRA